MHYRDPSRDPSVTEIMKLRSPTLANANCVMVKYRLNQDPAEFGDVNKYFLSS